MSRVLCFGELLLRLSPQLKGDWLKQQSMAVHVGGSELNVASALAIWQVPASYFTVLPDNYLTVEIISDLNVRGINLSKVKLSGNRVGIYYLPQNADLKHTSVIYDRENSSFSEIQPGELDWEYILQDVSWFHFSAISPALNQNIADVCLEAVKIASKKGITISVDLNYRSKLWQYGKQPYEIMPNLVNYCNVIMGNIWAKEKMLRINFNQGNTMDRQFFIDASLKSSELLMQEFDNCKQVANTFRFDVGKGIKYYASLYEKNNIYLSKELSTNSIIDKVGSGDTFMAGLIYGKWNNYNSQQIVDFASLAAFNKLFIIGDATKSTVEEILNQPNLYE